MRSNPRKSSKWIRGRHPGPIQDIVPDDAEAVARKLAIHNFEIERLRRLRGKVERVFVNGQGHGVYGDGSDGDVVLTGNITLTRDMFYRNLDTAGFAINTAGFRIHVRETLTIREGSEVGRKGNNATGAIPGTALPGGAITGTSAAGGAGRVGPGAGTVGGSVNDALGGSGGAGGAAGGVANPPTATRGYPRSLPTAITLIAQNAFTPFNGAAGGGGGNGGAITGIPTDTSKDGGGGGSGGGLVVIAARKIIHDGTITAKGGNGAAASGANGCGGQGGGGGGGGAVILVYAIKEGASGVVDVSGGAAGGSGGSCPGGTGNPGLSGTQIELAVY